MLRRRWIALGLLYAAPLCAQDASTGAIRGTVEDPSGARIVGAQVVATNEANGLDRRTLSDGKGTFAAQLLSPGEYTVRVAAAGMQTELQHGIRIEIGSATQVAFQLSVAGKTESITVHSEAHGVESEGVSRLIDSRAINDLPLASRRFTDLALLTPGVTQDPRGLTAGTNGDLSFGGVRGFQTSFLVDGADNNNAFFSQFSDEVVSEFRVASNSYGAEHGRAGGAVINVVTKSGGNRPHGSGFYYLRDNALNARPFGVDSQPTDQQHQGGFTLGGPLRKNRVFVFSGFDQHVFFVPTLVRFDDGSAVVTPKKGQEPLYHGDYEDSDKDMVMASAAHLSSLGGNYQSQLLGDTGFLKTDFALNSRNQLSLRVSTSRYWGANNVFLDPASPITNFGLSENGEESVNTETAALSLNSAVTARLTNHLRAQVSRDLQSSTTNSRAVRTRISSVIEGFGRSTILPRHTNEDRLHLAETMSLEAGRSTWKFGGDALLTRINNFFPSLSGGEYIFSAIKVDPFTFVPEEGGLELTPLRAYAHGVPRYYIQNFGTATTHPDAKEYAAFAQDTIRLRENLNISLGVRYDLQTFSESGMVSNPLWPQAGRLPHATNDFAPRAGFSWSLGDDKPLVFRGGFGIFYARIPQIYTSALATNNGVNSFNLILDNTKLQDREIFPQGAQLFPTYPSPLAPCAPNANICTPPAGLLSYLTSDVSAFAPNYHTPQVQQSSISVEKELARRTSGTISFLHVHGLHLIRARDVNLPPPTEVQYPVYDSAGVNLLGYGQVDTFSTWQLTKSFTCPYPPCINPLARPIPQLGAINQFETEASSQYNGLTVSLQRRLNDGLYFRLGYTWAHAVDDGPDALIAGQPGNVQNSYGTALEKASSVTDQRHRFVFSMVAEPNPIPAGQPGLSALFNHWKLASVVTIGSGRPYDAKVAGDPNQDGNSLNDRLPGLGRNALVGPAYSTTDSRFSRNFRVTNNVRLSLLIEAFNLFNHLNKRVLTDSGGFVVNATDFVPFSQRSGATYYPAQYRRAASLTGATGAYAPRQVQVAVRLSF
jgi:hypothetical protein